VIFRGRLLFLVGLAALAIGCSEEALPEADAHGGDLAAGRVIFQKKCARCHNGNGDGQTPVAGRFPYANLIDGVWRSDGSSEAIEKQIRHGRDPMPKFEGKLTDEQIRQTVEYVLELTGGRREAAR
jgi:mono/diheme cytochrome c family protein